MRLSTAVERMGDPEQLPGDDWSSGWPQSADDFDDFIRVFQDRLVNYAFRRLRDFHEAEDVIQEVFVKAFTNRAQMSRVSRVVPYLYRMAANMCTDRLRRRRPVIVRIDDIDVESITDTRSNAARLVEATESIRRTDQLLARLPDAQAETLRLRVIDELSIEEIAEVQGCSVETAKSRFRYGVGKLRRVLSKAKERLQ